MSRTYDVNIERAVLSSILFNPENFEQIHVQLKPEDFYLVSHQKIYEVMQELHNKELPIDEEFIRKRINDKNVEDSVFLEILSSNPITNTAAYVKEIKESSNKKSLSLQLSKISAKLQDDDSSSSFALQEIELMLEQKKKNVFTRFSPKIITDISDAVIEYWIKDWLPIPKNIIALLTAKGGTGKSALAIQIAQRITKENSASKVLVWLSEDPLGVSKIRANDIRDMLEIENQTSIDYLGNETIPFHLFKDEKKMEVSDDWFEFKQFAKKYDFIVLDPLIAYFGGDENSNSQARYFMNLLNEYCVKEDKTILLIHHHGKGTGESRGAGAFVDAVRLHYTIAVSEEEGADNRYRDIEIKKDNWNVQNILGHKKVSRRIFKNKFIERHAEKLTPQDNKSVKNNSKKKTLVEEKDYITFDV